MKSEFVLVSSNFSYRVCKFLGVGLYLFCIFLEIKFKKEYLCLENECPIGKTGTVETG